MISPMAVRNWSTPLKEGQYEDFAVSIFQVAEGFSVYLTDRSSNSAASSETWSTIAEAESYARNLAIDFVHQISEQAISGWRSRRRFGREMVD